MAFKAILGYSFYQNGIYDIAVQAKIQFAFISIEDVPIIPSLGMRFTFNFFYMDIGFAYAFGISETSTLLLSGFLPAVSLGFRF